MFIQKQFQKNNNNKSNLHLHTHVNNNNNRIMAELSVYFEINILVFTKNLKRKLKKNKKICVYLGSAITLPTQRRVCIARIKKSNM